MDRGKIIVRTSIIGITANIFLAVFKASIGFLTNSIAIVLDAVNNLSDALSSVITIIATKLALRKPDKEHPLGHGRIENLSAVLISVIVLYAGITSLIVSVKKIFNPSEPTYDLISLLIIVVAVVVKLILGSYVKKIGVLTESDSLIASGEDARFDALISLATLIAAIIFLLSKISLESYLGVIISIVIVKSGFELLKNSLSEIIGERIDANISLDLKKTISEFEEVYGVYDLILHKYGPKMIVGSVHIEVANTMTIDELDDLERRITDKVFEKNKIIIAGISIYSKNVSNQLVDDIHNNIRKIVLSYDYVIQMHGFFINEKDKKIRFDVVIDFECENREKLKNDITEKILNNYPDFDIKITIDNDITD